jgi:hypothetical protein
VGFYRVFKLGSFERNLAGIYFGPDIDHYFTGGRIKCQCVTAPQVRAELHGVQLHGAAAFLLSFSDCLGNGFGDYHGIEIVWVRFDFEIRLVKILGELEVERIGHNAEYAAKTEYERLFL